MQRYQISPLQRKSLRGLACLAEGGLVLHPGSFLSGQAVREQEATRLDETARTRWQIRKLNSRQVVPN
jgi:hypothetical protein